MKNKLEKIIEHQDAIIDQQGAFINKLLKMIERLQDPPVVMPSVITTDTIRPPFEVTCTSEIQS